jgi:hypothetical protein
MSMRVCARSLCSRGQYGYRPFPPAIPSAEYEQLASAVRDADDKALLSRWYREDCNALVPQYILQVCVCVCMYVCVCV